MFCFERDSFFKNTEEFCKEGFFNDKTYKTGVLFAKMLFFERKRIENLRKGRFHRKEKLFLSDVFWRKICEGEYFNTRIFLQRLAKKEANRNLFCFFLIQQK